MTTPANNGRNGGANQPEDDDPFGYLYADGQAGGATPPPPGGGYGYPGPTVGGHPGGQPGVPRTSYNQVRTVGERTYGGQRGQVPAQQQPQGYQPQYPAPETLQAGGYGVPPQGGPAPQAQPLPRSGHGGGTSSSRRGMLIAAVAVVAAVAIGIGAALAFGGDKDKDKDKGAQNQAGGGQTPSAAPKDPTAAPSTSASPEAPLPKADASGTGFSLAGGASPQSTIKGAKGGNGLYVGGLNNPGASVTWTLDVPKAGTYKLKMTYGVPGKDAEMSFRLNDATDLRKINMKNFAKAAPGDWEKGWTNTWVQVDLKQGSNTVRISCEPGNSCDVNLDQLWLERM
ncbi:carbohydrate-binding protein [Streptomyces antimicrobicus]|uniref:Carbohydrate-binding protein n=1 Tax=Streptomyces antimicrobicus TaxID=2883108 RepID=A0ABS8B2M4_9ACTN|nr:carbohydrate-binding protein [Streptomyces antimicrobicus]MCB5178860.1 carbohydrate-binding protein [Streptomyces antimicrobicus]